MASPHILTNNDLQFVNVPGQSFNAYVAFLNPINITTTWSDLQQDTQGNWQAPPDVDTLAKHVAPYKPTPNLGSNRIGFVNEPLYFDGSRSFQRYDLPVMPGSYQWNVTGPTSVQYYSGNSQCAVIWSSPGLYTISLTVKDSAGTSATSTRQIMIYQDRDSVLPGIISISGLAGNLTSGGWQCQLTTVNSQATLYPADALAIGTYQPVVVLIETRYEIAPGYWVTRTIGPHGNFSPGYPYQDPRIFFDGYIQSDSIHQDVDKDTLSFSCSGPQLLLQEAKTHQLGYYNTTVKSHAKDGTPTALNTSSMGKGHLVSGLMSTDVVMSLLWDHSTIGQYHDIHAWNATIPTNPYNPNDKNAYYNMIYSTLSVNEGTIWSCIQDLTANEWSQIYCERDGSIRVGPQINYRGNEYWSRPTLLGTQSGAELINYVQDLGYTVGTTLSTMPKNLPILPASPIPLNFIHQWGHHVGIPVISRPFQSNASPEAIATLAKQYGPPILCVFSDVPFYDNDVDPPTSMGLYPWTMANWPQDLAVYPVSFDITETYTGKTSLVKLIGTLANSSSIWTSWYPQSAFKVAPDGVSTVVASVLPAGNWLVDQSKVLPDVLSKQQKQLVSNWWWEMARRVYYAQNIYYQCSITLGMFTAASLGDIVAVTRQANTLGPHWSERPFYIEEISYSLDMTSRSWTTSINTTEVTSALLTAITPPPKVVPKI